MMNFRYFQAPMEAIAELAYGAPTADAEGKILYYYSAVDIAPCSLCSQERPYLYIECEADGTGGRLQSTFFLSEDIDLQQLKIVSRRPIAVPAEPKFYYRGCLECLGQGRFTTAHDTEVGSVNNSQLNAEGEVRVSIPKEAVEELARTPNFGAWQWSLWLTHCNDFMIYLGEWGPDDFNQHAPDGNGKALHAQVVQDWGEPEAWDDLRDDGFYVFKCAHCSILRSYSTFD